MIDDLLKNQQMRRGCYSDLLCQGQSMQVMIQESFKTVVARELSNFVGSIIEYRDERPVYIPPTLSSIRTCPYCNSHVEPIKDCPHCGAPDGT